MAPTSNPLRCPKCGSTNLTLCGDSVQYGPEERAGQPLEERELRTSAYKCECGLGFTQTVPRESLSGDSDAKA
jgi:hypothetical protein